MNEPSAEWRLHPIAERETARERRRTLGARRFGWALAVATFGVCPLSCLGVALNSLSGMWMLATFAAIAGLAFSWLWQGSRNAEAARGRRKALRETYGAVEGWTAELTVFQGAAPTGRDRGALWFEDGRLYFVGERTSFGLAPQQVERGIREGSATDGLRAAAMVSVVAWTAAGQVALGLDLLPEYHGPRYSDERSFRRAFDDWVANGEGAAGQLPPLAPGPDVPSPGALLAQATSITAAWVVLIASLLVVGLGVAWWVVPPIAAILGVLLVLWPAFWAPHLRWRAWRDRRRLR